MCNPKALFVEARKQRSLIAATAALSENPAESLREALEAYRIRADADTREAVLTAASVPRGTVIAGLPGEARVAGMVLTPDQRQVVTYDAHGGIRVIDDNGRTKKTAKASRTGVSAAATSPRASHVALATDQGSAAVINIGTGEQINLATNRSPISTIWWLESSPDNLILVVTTSGVVSTYSATTGQQVTRLPDPVYWARPTAEGQIVTSDQDRRLRVWNARTGANIAESSPLAAPAKNLQPYTHEAIGVTKDNNLIRLIKWDWGAGTEPRVYPLNGAKAFDLVTVNEVTRTVDIVADKAVSIHSLDDGSLQRSLPKQPSWPQDMEPDPSGRWIATAGNNGVQVWSAKDPGTPSRATYELIAPGGVQRVSFLPDGKSLIFLSSDGTVRFSDLPQTQRFDLDDRSLVLDVSADGRWLAAASADGTVHIVDPTGAPNGPVVTVRVGGPVEAVKFDPTDPHRIVTLQRSGKQPT